MQFSHGFYTYTITKPFLDVLYFLIIRIRSNKNTFVPVVEKRFQVITGLGFPLASHGRKASEFDKTVKLAALPPTILGLFFKTCVVVSKSTILASVALLRITSSTTVMVSKVRPLSGLPLAALFCKVGLTLLIGGRGVV